MSFQTTIIQWFRENGRELPWRETHDPYAIWLSEIILQQTRIEQGQPYWERFMLRWPTVEALAAASEDAVLREWQGLGYYSRARNLLTAARQIVERGGFPTTIEGLRQLKGVGDYTAAAIGSIAFGLPAAVVDGNVYRVLSRYYGIATPINTTEGKKEFTALAQELMSGLSGKSGKSGEPGESEPSALYNQGLMDFGAIVCTPQSPHCESCPLMESCSAFRERRISELPVKLRTLKVKERQFTYIYVRWNGQTAIHRRPAGDIWQGLYEPVLIDHSQPTIDSWAAQNNYQLSNRFSKRIVPLGQRTDNCQLLASQVKHVLTHRVIYADFWLWEPAERPTLPDDYFWIQEDEIDHYGVPRLVDILLDEIKKRS